MADPQQLIDTANKFAVVAAFTQPMWNALGSAQTDASGFNTNFSHGTAYHGHQAQESLSSQVDHTNHPAVSSSASASPYPLFYPEASYASPITDSTTPTSTTGTVNNPYNFITLTITYPEAGQMKSVSQNIPLEQPLGSQPTEIGIVPSGTNVSQPEIQGKIANPVLAAGRTPA